MSTRRVRRSTLLAFFAVGGAVVSCQSTSTLAPTGDDAAADAFPPPQADAAPEDATIDALAPETVPTCSSTERCAEYTSSGPACLPGCTASAADASEGADAGGCLQGSVCIQTSGCCQGTACSAVSVSVCCPVDDAGVPTCGDVIAVFPPPQADAAPDDAAHDGGPDDAALDALAHDAGPTCSSMERCAQYTSSGAACLPGCAASAADAGAGADAGGCRQGSVCIETSGCCQGGGCTAVLVSVCCPVDDAGVPTCGDVVAVFPPR